jgi:putative ABC transport system permease protein
LFALAAFTAEQRRKEIGVRKVLGASVAGITGLLAKDFLKLVILAIFIASPIAYYFMQKWLADFAYRIDIQGWMFVAAAMAALGIAFLTVSFQSIRAALANPVESLRSE